MDERGLMSVYRSRRMRWRRARRLLTVNGLVLFGVACGAAGWLAIRASETDNHLQAAARLVPQLQQRIQDGDARSARATLVALQEQLSAARENTHDPLWRVGTHVPVIGSDLAAIATVAAALDDLARDGLPGVVAVAGSLDPAAIAPKDGHLDLGPVVAAGPGVRAADAAVQRARDRVGAIRTDDLLRPVRTPVIGLQRQLDAMAARTGTARRAATLLPPMLGADGPRTYLVLFQNLAEVRATGGMFGAFAVVRADRGAIRIVEQGTASGDLGVFDEPVLPLDPAMKALYTQRLGIFPADVNLTPHFPTAATLAREMYRRRTGRTVDGVLATDPVALSYVLRGSGPVRLPTGGTLTGENAVRLLLSESYGGVASPAEKERFFAGAARATFDTLIRGQGSQQATFEGLVRAAGERRLLVWSGRPDEQRLIAGTVLEGALPEQDGARPVVGVFLNDGTGAKLDYYLRQSVDLTAGACRADRRRELRLRVTLRSAAPPRGLPAYVLGMGLGGRPYTIRTNVLVFAPTGGGVVEARIGGKRVPVGTGVERGRAVGVVTVDLPPGSSQTLDMALLTGVLPGHGDAAMAPTLRTTPTVAAWTYHPKKPFECGR